VAGSPASGLIGRRIARIEDSRLLRGQGCFIDDIELPGLLHAAFLRSPHAHARIRRIDAAAARAAPGVRAVLTYAELRPLLTADRIPLALPSAAIRFDVDPPCLAAAETCHVGEPIALVVAAGRALAEDAVRLVEVAYEPLAVVLDPRAGLEPDAPKARLDCLDNLVARHAIEYGEVDAAFAAAAHIVRECFRLNKGGGHSIETRGVVAQFDSRARALTVWDGTQMPHRAKAVFHPEELAVPAAAMLLGAPVKWIEDRIENFTATAQEREQIWEMQAAFDRAGRLKAVRGEMFHDHGAATPYGVALPYNAATNLIGPYVLPAYRLTVSLCLTNVVPASATRGAGRPQGTFVMERLLDRAARDLSLSRDEIRRRNLIAAQLMPYATPVKQRDGSAMVYDSGDYPASQAKALAAAGFADFPARQEAARRQGRAIGLGLGNYVEGTGRGPFESAAVRLGRSGTIVVTTGASDQGQGTCTMLAQIVAGVLGTSVHVIHVVAGDTAASPLGLGAFASRQTVTAGNAVRLAALAVAEKAKLAASTLIEASAADLELAEGMVRVKGVPGLGRSLAEVAHALSGVPGYALPGNIAPGLAAAIDYQPAAMTYCSGTHVCEAEVDCETGAVRLLRYVVVHDCGRMINPLMVEGQVLGGVAHGIGAALFERMQFDAVGQPLTASYADYLLPTCDVLPPIEIHHMESPSPLNPLGVKGATESGTVGALNAIVSAIEDALLPLDVRITDLPVTPPRLLELIREAEQRMQGGQNRASALQVDEAV
jgi:carbon-monoxide dehydrogenase large subunit